MFGYYNWKFARCKYQYFRNTLASSVIICVRYHCINLSVVIQYEPFVLPFVLRTLSHYTITWFVKSKRLINVNIKLFLK